MNIELFHIAVAAFFAIISLSLAGATLFNVLRLRNVRMSWKGGKMWGWPLFSSLFLCSIIPLMGYSIFSGTIQEKMVFGLYFIAGAGWFIASYLASKRFVTDNGIVKNINEPSQTVAWYEIRDFVEAEGQKDNIYIFFYHNVSSGDEMIRLEFEVPFNKQEAFQKLISHKLGRRINCYNDTTIDLRQLVQN